MSNEDPNDTSCTPASNIVDGVMADASNQPQTGFYAVDEPLTAKRRRERAVLEQYNSIPNLSRAELETLARGLLNDRDALQDKIDAYEAGMAAEDGDERASYTPATLWRKMLNSSETLRTQNLQRLIEIMESESSCFLQNHRGRISNLEYELQDARVQLGAVLGFSEDRQGLPSLQQFVVAVQALRNVMVDGIAARGQVLTAELDELELPDFRHPDLSAERAKVTESLKDAGIDLASVCGYSWKGPATDSCDGGVHECRLVNPLHSQDHACDPRWCGQTLSHDAAEKLAEAGQ